MQITEDLWYLDLEYLGASNLIACGVIKTEAGLLLVDPGPTTSLDRLRHRLGEHGYALADVHALLLTHIHLDHAGATGSIVALQPSMQVYVHSIGARHLIRPERLLASAQRLYGEMMEPLWGTFLPVPEANVHDLSGGETLEIGGREVEVAYTPGHAIHHVSYLDRASGTAFIGDVGGMRVTGVDYVIPVTPPPDVDLEAWHESLNLVRNWLPERLFVTHFGPSDEVDAHLSTMGRRLDAWAEEVKQAVEGEQDRNAAAVAFNEEKMAVLRRTLPPEMLPAYEQFGSPQTSWHGLARYWRKKLERRNV